MSAALLGEGMTTGQMMTTGQSRTAGQSRTTGRLVGAVILLSAAATVGTTERSLDVWMVPHAHCDVGWLMSVDGYFNARRWDGSENSQSVSNILTEVTKALSADETLRFIWSETKWIEMWWPQQTPAMQAAFKRIVKRGQLEFVGAGWSQNDEVTTAYYDVIDNQVAGHEYLRRTGLLDECPQPGRCIRFGWQVCQRHLAHFFSAVFRPFSTSWRQEA